MRSPRGLSVQLSVMFLTQPSWPHLPTAGTCSWSSLDLSSESSHKHPLTLGFFQKGQKEELCLYQPPSSLFSRITFNFMPSHVHLPTGQTANCPVLVHFMLTFFINPPTICLIWLVSTVVVPIAKKSAVYTPPWDGERDSHIAIKRGANTVWAPTMCQTLCWAFNILLQLVLIYY